VYPAAQQVWCLLSILVCSRAANHFIPSYVPPPIRSSNIWNSCLTISVNYNMLGGTLNLTQSINLSCHRISTIIYFFAELSTEADFFFCLLWHECHYPVLYTFSAQLHFIIFHHNHISKASIFFHIDFVDVQASAGHVSHTMVVAPSGERLRGKAGMVFVAGKTVWYMPECFKVVCIPCKALYKCSALLCSISVNCSVLCT